MQTITCSVKKKWSQLTLSNFKQTSCEKHETILYLIEIDLVSTNNCQA